MSAFSPNAATNPDFPHNSLASRTMGLCSTLLVLVVLVVGARFWVRLGLVKARLRGDDWCIFVAWVLTVAFNLNLISQAKTGLGRHIYDLSPDTNFNASLKHYYFGEMIYTCVAVTEVAILFLYLRLATERTCRYLIWTCMTFVVITSLSCVIASIFQCQPIRKAWDAKGVVPGHCFNANALFFANAALDIFQDIVIYILPMRMLYHIQIPRRQKIPLMLVFGVGGFVVVTGIIRLNSLKVAQNTPDPSYNDFGATSWSAVESNVGASLPHFKPFFDHCFPNLMGRGQAAFKRTLKPRSSVTSPRRDCIQDFGLTEMELQHGTNWKAAYIGERNLGNNRNADVMGELAPESTASSDTLPKE